MSISLQQPAFVDTGPGDISSLLAIFFAFFIIMLVLSIAYYVYLSLALMTIARKNEHGERLDGVDTNT